MDPTFIEFWKTFVEFLGGTLGIALAIGLWISLGLLAANVADSKGHPFGWWVLWGFLLGFFGLVAAAGLGDRCLQGLKQQDETRRLASHAQTITRVRTEDN